jgi:hypothetical protein
MGEGRSLPDRLHHHAYQVPGRVVEVLEGLAVCLGTNVSPEIRIHVLDGRLETVQAIVQSPEVDLSDDDLSGRNLQRVSSSASLKGALAVRAATEPPRSTGTGLLGQWAVAPAAPVSVA